MTDFNETKPDDPLRPEEEAKVRLLTLNELQCIDERLLSNISHQWRKMARVIAMTMADFPGVPTAYYSLRIKQLAESGAIEAAGNLNRMRYSEIRKASK